MKFELKPNNRDSSDQDLLNDLREVANKLGVKAISRTEYDKHGRYSEGTIRKRFGGWLNALEKAKLAPVKNYLTDQQLIDEIKRVSQLPNIKTISKVFFNQNSEITNSSTIERRFGSWLKALKKAELDVSCIQSRYSNDELFVNILKTWTCYGRQPTINEMNSSPSKISGNTYVSRFGNWRQALEAFVEYANSGEIEAYIENMNYNNDSIIEKSVSAFQHKTSRTINLRLRFLVMKRDRFKCQSCGRSPASQYNTVLHVDHIKP